MLSPEINQLQLSTTIMCPVAWCKNISQLCLKEWAVCSVAREGCTVRHWKSLVWHYQWCKPWELLQKVLVWLDSQDFRSGVEEQQLLRKSDLECTYIRNCVSIVPHVFIKKKVNKHSACRQNFSVKIWTHLHHLLDPETCQSLHSLIAMSLSRLILILPLCALLSNTICIKKQ